MGIGTTMRGQERRPSVDGDRSVKWVPFAAGTVAT